MPADRLPVHALPAPEDWTSYAGRPGAGLITAEVADLTLRVAEIVAELKLPAALTPAVLSVATLEFVDRVQPADEDDWRTLVTTAGRLTPGAGRGLHGRARRGRPAHLRLGRVGRGARW